MARRNSLNKIASKASSKESNKEEVSKTIDDALNLVEEEEESQGDAPVGPVENDDDVAPPNIRDDDEDYTPDPVIPRKSVVDSRIPDRVEDDASSSVAEPVSATIQATVSRVPNGPSVCRWRWDDMFPNMPFKPGVRVRVPYFVASHLQETGLAIIQQVHHQ